MYLDCKLKSKDICYLGKILQCKNWEIPCVRIAGPKFTTNRIRGLGKGVGHNSFISTKLFSRYWKINSEDF